MYKSLNMSELDLSRSIKGNCDGVAGFPIYDFILMVNGDTCLLYS